MSKMLIAITEGSKVTAVYADDNTVADVMVKEADNDPIRMTVGVNPEIISEEEAKCLITSDRLRELEEEAKAEEAAESVVDNAE